MSFSTAGMLHVLLLALAACQLAPCHGAAWAKREAPVHRRRRVDGTQALQVAQGCLHELQIPQPLDHFTHHQATDAIRWQQRYFRHDCFWSTDQAGRRGPVFFYTGNEADVELYVNATGLIWENAQQMGALVLFAEHRYYGKSQPFGPNSWQVDPAYLTAEQAMADFAALMWALKQEPGAQHSPIVVFGGSYGGMLSAWMRIKYPHLVAGAIAASAPLGAFPGDPSFRPQAFWEVVTRDATAVAGAPATCANNTAAAFRALLGVGSLPEGRATLSKLLRLCQPLQSQGDVVVAAFWLQGAWDAFAMGNYPWPSSYISGDPDHPLPAWPMRVACQSMTKTLHRYQSDLIQGLRDAAGLLYNATGNVSCYELDGAGPAAGNTGPWDFQFCTEQLAQEVPYFPSTGTTDMFWDQGPWDEGAIREHCQAAWGVQPSMSAGVTEWGGLEAARHTSNIVFSNGLYDPWSAFGVLSDVSDTVVAVVIPEGAHHLDLMFSHPDDPASVTAARQVELSHIRRWVAQAATAQSAKGTGRLGVRSSSGSAPWQQPLKGLNSVML